MKKLCTTGFKVSSVDQKALDHYLLTTPKEWAEAGLKGMINKAVKSIMRDWLEVYKSKQTGSISGDVTVLIPAIIAMGEFKSYNTPTPQLEGPIEREAIADQEIWEGGFDVEDYEEQALNAFYEDPEEMLMYFMENKVFQRRKRFVKENEQGFLQRKEDIPAKQDDFINAVCGKPEYKNRVESENES